MRQADYSSEYIAVDWGSSNRRGWRLGAGGMVTDSFADDAGVLSVGTGRFERGVAEIRERLGDLPMLLGGMIGSNRGWQEAPYVACPAGAEDVASNILWVDDRTGIAPGVSQSDPPDVMRGEEIQALGAVAVGLARPDGLLCLPGTHSKWVAVAGGRLAAFHTAMTGEIFGLLKEHSILSDLLAGEVADGPAFDRGVADALEGRPLGPALFGIRARHLLGQSGGDEASYASGLLIGTDWRDGANSASGGVVGIIGSASLCTLYAKAASLAGNDAEVIDGGDAFVAGINLLRESIR